MLSPMLMQDPSTSDYGSLGEEACVYIADEAAATEPS
jgi:hypothetical protein